MDTTDLEERLTRVDAEVAAAYPGDTGRRQPVHTVYGGAHLFTADTAAKLGAQARRALDAYAPDPASLAEATGLDLDLAEAVYPRVVDKLEREPVEDLRIDFEDGYGNRPDDEEDADAARAAREVATGLAAGTLPPFLGIRIKPLSGDLRARSWRTLLRFVATLEEATGGGVPDGFVVTLPKVVHPEQVAVLAELLGRLEVEHGLPERSLPLEIMVETTPSVVGRDGHVAVRRLVDAAGGRCTGAHFGTYDYTASCAITAAHQHMTHPACDFARHVVQVALGGTGVWLSDGATNVLPVPPHRGDDVSAAQRAENRRVVHHAWRLHVAHIRHSLVHAYYQGWDLHPAQLPTRYAAVYAFFLEQLEPAGRRLRHFVEAAAKATLVGDVFDDAATGQGLLNFFLRAVNCGAVDEAEAVARSGLSLDELRSRSFPTILTRRRTGSVRSGG